MRAEAFTPLQQPLSKRLRPLAYTLIGVVAFILVLTWVTLQVQIALAGFLNGESVWSKAQKQAVVDLLNYAGSGDPADYADFQHNYAVLTAYRSARDKVAFGNFDYDAVENQLRSHGVMQVALPTVIFALNHFAGAPYMDTALASWRATDDAVSRLEIIAAELHRSYADGRMSAGEIARQRARINSINEFIQPRSKRFSRTIAEGAVAIGRVLFFCVFFCAAAALLLWLLMARRTLKRIHGSEGRYRLLFDGAADAIVMVDEASGRVLDANRAASAWTGRDPRELRGTAYADLFERSMPRGLAGGGELRRVDGSTRPVEMQSSMTTWGRQVVRQAIIRDVSERVKSDRELRIAARALASIAEGVIIADAERRVISSNAAVTRLTGFTARDLAGTRFDDSRGMPGGGPLSPSIWEEIARASHWSGEVRSRRKDDSTYAEGLSISTIRDADQCIQRYVAVFTDISLAKAAERRLQHLAAHDPLTGLVNRAEFQRRCDAAIERAVSQCGAVAVLFIDFDAFKFVNDSFSHAIGDRLLRLAADRIRHQLGEPDVIGRIGGDEFTVLLPKLMQREDAGLLAGRLVSALSRPFYFNDYEIVLSASIGVAAFPLDGGDSASLIGNADAAMYAAKSQERNTWRFYAPRMQADAQQRLRMAAELRQALLNDEFHLVYQPSVELRSGRILGVEALLRWQHPERGKVLPGEFIPIAESIGMIHRIDEWVMRRVCEQLHVWDELGMPQIRVAINVSARWFGHPGFVEKVRHTLQANGIAPRRVVLEVTESAVLRLSEETEQTMRALHGLGVGVAIDDFGAGYSSMGYLKLPAIAYLKVDASFVAGLPDDANDSAITTAILAMADSLGLTTIAEGIETEPQHEFLLRAGCLEGQGFLYSYPLPPETIERMLRRKPLPAGDAKLRLVSRLRD